MGFLAGWIAWQVSHPILTFLIYELAGLIGMIVHFMKLNIKGQTADDIISYFKNNFKYTISSTLITLFAAGTAFIMGQGMMAAFLAGYAFDSAVNKGA